jgi:hypothetical protein
MINYDRYTELLSKTIHKTITAPEKEMVAEYEASTPDRCPKCSADLWTTLEPYRVMHDVEKCTGKGLV